MNGTNAVKWMAAQREAGNVHDSNAVAVYFHTDQLGYVPCL